MVNNVNYRLRLVNPLFAEKNFMLPVDINTVRVPVSALDHDVSTAKPNQPSRGIRQHIVRVGNALRRHLFPCASRRRRPSTASAEFSYHSDAEMRQPENSGAARSSHSSSRSSLATVTPSIASLGSTRSSASTISTFGEFEDVLNTYEAQKGERMVTASRRAEQLKPHVKVTDADIRAACQTLRVQLPDGALDAAVSLVNHFAGGRENCAKSDHAERDSDMSFVEIVRDGESDAKSVRFVE
ncbi:hypothetical protein ACJ51O_36985 (plasmid) [Burkholderia pyrrocinia]|uniref:hypothetical protein n=1 Tax=Burkholderia pyrrocinia TaxID=60550 RepID=UPI0038B48D6E